MSGKHHQETSKKLGGRVADYMYFRRVYKVFNLKYGDVFDGMFGAYIDSWK